MVKEKINCAVFISGRGTNLKSIFRYSKKRGSRINLKLVISNRSEALGINFAKNNKIDCKIINYKNTKKAEKKIFNHLEKYKIKFIFLF